MLRKIIVILGPTASGKSELAIRLAKKFGGEIISADSRQVYKGLDIGTGKVPRDKNWKLDSNPPATLPSSAWAPIGNWKLYYHKGVQHHLLDVVSPKRRFTVVQYRKLALKAIDKIFKKQKVPILCGGTGFYIQAVVNGIVIPEVPPDWKLRKKLGKKPVKKLYQMLKKLDPRRAKTIERKNKRRLIRALEIVKKIGPVPIFKENPLSYPVLIIGVKKEKEELKKIIKKRFLRWLKMGLIAEVKRLRKLGLSFKKIEEFGIHYRVIACYLEKKLTKKEMIKNSLKELQNYAKRQMTWFKRHPAPEPSVQYGASKIIHWVKDYKEAEKLVKEFLVNKKGESLGRSRT